MLIAFVPKLKSRFSISFFVFLLLSGCSQSTSPHYPLQTPNPLYSASVTLTPPDSRPGSLGIGVSLNVGKGIHVESASGFVCQFSPQGSPTPGTLVLPTVQPNYDQGTLLSLRNYLNAVGAGFVGGRPDMAPYPVFSADSTAFQLVAVNTADMGCSEVLQLTNNGKAAVQISQVSLQFMQDTQANTQRYNLIDACSLSLNFLSQRCPPGLGAQEPGYVAQFNLHWGKATTIMSATCWGYDDTIGCSPQKLTLQPGDFAKVTLWYFSNAQSNLSLSLQPIFTLDWTGQQTMSYPAPQLRVTFAFASLSQFSCYSLQNQQFVETSLDEHHWCL
jgi:hypothetical protein